MNIIDPYRGWRAEQTGGGGWISGPSTTTPHREMPDEPLTFPGAAGRVITLNPGDVYRVDEPLTLRVREVGYGLPVLARTEWVAVEGTALHPDGSDRGYRSALVRVSALRDLLRPSDQPEQATP